jgi:hypothetical protein
VAVPSVMAADKVDSLTPRIGVIVLQHF